MSAFPELFVDVTNHEELVAQRDEDGNLPETTFAHLKETSQSLIDKGTKIDATNYRGIDINGIEYEGEAPDLGAFEYEDEISSAIRIVSQESATGGVRLFQTKGGMVVITVDAPASGCYTAVLCDAAGRTLGTHAFRGQTTAVRMPRGANGMVVLKVTGDSGFSAAAKAIVR